MNLTGLNSPSQHGHGGHIDALDPKIPEFGADFGHGLCRVWDDDLHPAAWHIARDQSLEMTAPALRFARYATTVLLGAHEQPEIAVRTEFCHEQGIDLVRRPTGGGALFLDPGQLVWTLALPTLSAEWADLAGVLDRHGTAVADALQALGADVRFVFPNDLEFAGRKVGTGFAVRHSQGWIIQGSLLLAPPDVETMLKALRVPTEKLSHEGVLSARQRLRSISEILQPGWVPTDSAPLGLIQPGCANTPPLGLSLTSAAQTALDLELLRTKVIQVLAETLTAAFSLHQHWQPAPQNPPVCLPETGSASAASAAAQAASATTVPMTAIAASAPAWAQLKAFLKTDGGALYLRLEVDPEQRIVAAQFSGAVQLNPGDLFSHLQTALRGQPANQAVTALNTALAAHATIELLGFQSEDLLHLLRLALARQEQSENLGLSLDQANTLIIHNPAGETAPDILAHATVMLVPYCAKLADCKFRHRDGCSECGKCEVGDAYRLARERGMQVISITHFEHLQATLNQMRADGVPAYIGMCCESFYLKRHHAFQEAGIPAVLTDITGTTCYELREEDLAYAGKFRAEAKLKLDVVEQVMHFVPGVAGTPDGKSRKKLDREKA